MKEFSVSVAMGQIRRAQAGSIYNNRKNLSLHYIIKFGSVASYKLDHRSERSSYQNEASECGDGENSAEIETKVDSDHNWWRYKTLPE